MLKEKINKGSSHLLSRWLSGSLQSQTVHPHGHGKENVQEQREMDIALELSLRECQDASNIIDEDDWFQATPSFTKRQYHDTHLKRKLCKDKERSVLNANKEALASGTLLSSSQEHNAVKKETSTQHSDIEVDDLSSWIDLKTEHSTQTEDQLEVEDLSMWINEYGSAAPSNNADMAEKESVTLPISVEETERPLQKRVAAMASSAEIPDKKNTCVECPLCMRKYQEHIIEQHASECTGLVHTTAEEIPGWQGREHSPINEIWSDDEQPLTNKTDAHALTETTELSETVTLSDGEESDCSVINLCDGRQDDQEDEGYLSPLEGFTSILARSAEEQRYQRYFNQGSHPTSEQEQPQRGTSNIHRGRAQQTTTRRTSRAPRTPRPPQIPRTETRASQPPQRRRGNWRGRWRYSKKARQTR